MSILGGFYMMNSTNMSSLLNFFFSRKRLLKEKYKYNRLVNGLNCPLTWLLHFELSFSLIDLNNMTFADFPRLEIVIAKPKLYTFLFSCNFLHYNMLFCVAQSIYLKIQQKQNKDLDSRIKYGPVRALQKLLSVLQVDVVTLF